MATAPVLAGTGLVKRFGGLNAVDHVNIQGFAGEIVGVVGPNGSGKTTLFNMLAGALRPNAGQITVKGKVQGSRTVPSKYCHNGVARTFQIPRPFVDLTAYQNVWLPASMGAPRVGRDTDEWTASVLRLFGLERVEGVKAGYLPTGTQKLLEVARAYATWPDALLLDEAMAGLAADEIELVISAARELAGTDRLVIFIEHLLSAVSQLAQRIVVMDSGQIIASGKPSDVWADPAVVAAYLGVAPSGQKDGKHS